MVFSHYLRRFSPKLLTNGKNKCIILSVVRNVRSRTRGIENRVTHSRKIQLNMLQYASRRVISPYGEYTHALASYSRRVIEAVITGEREKTIDNRFCEARHENKEKRKKAVLFARFDYIFGRARSLENPRVTVPFVPSKSLSYQGFSAFS